MAVYTALGIILLIFAGIQFVTVDRTNPPVIAEPNWDSPKTREYAVRACFDCHSNETKWPWYSYIAPVSWSVASHVHNGRKAFNISEFPAGTQKEGHEAAELVISLDMPLSDYLIMHSEAKFTEQEKNEFVQGLKNTFGSKEQKRKNSATEKSKDSTQIKEESKKNDNHEQEHEKENEEKEHH
ncbi:MAG: heme-binding domain-containing protein [Ignavibacteriaceae bacterium]|nr:heme-binding domain-containing protein [Ignavibacteriaceae bacterium]